jgi:hypothetical protein
VRQQIYRSIHSFSSFPDVDQSVALFNRLRVKSFSVVSDIHPPPIVVFIEYNIDPGSLTVFGRIVNDLFEDKKKIFP